MDTEQGLTQNNETSLPLNVPPISTTPDNNISTSPENTATVTNAKKKTSLFIIIAVVIAIGVLGILLVPKTSKLNHEKVANELSYLDTTMPLAIDSCERVRKGVDDSTTPADTYEIPINGCMNGITSLYERLDTLEQMIDQADVPEIQQLFNDYKTALDNNLPGPDKVKATTDAYRIIHNFVLALHYFNSGLVVTKTQEEMTTAINDITKSDNEEFAKIGKELSQLHNKTIEAWLQFTKTSDSTDFKNSVDVEKKFRDFAENSISDMVSLFPLGNNDNGEIDKPYNSLKNALNK